MAYICYSTASSNVLGHSDTIEGARAHATANGGSDEFAVILECPLSEASKLNSFDSPRSDMPVVWRGANDLAQFFRKSRV